MVNENEIPIITPKLPSFSIIIPVASDYPALSGTIRTLIANYSVGEHRDKLDIEVLVMGDGEFRDVQKVVDNANEVCKTNELGIKVAYHPGPVVGTGNIPRAAGLKLASKDWVVFLDAGTATCFRWLQTIIGAIQECDYAKVILWDMVLLLNPVPNTTTTNAVQFSDRTSGLPYVFPGNAIAVRRDCAQLCEWPNVRESDYAYTSVLWDKLFKKDGVEDQEEIDRSVVLIPWALTVAYAYRKHPMRWPLSQEEFASRGYNKGWEARAEEAALAAPEEASGADAEVG